jgi:hypothetical protein
MSGAIHPLPQYAFMAWYLVKAQGQIYLYLMYKNNAETLLEGDEVLSGYQPGQMAERWSSKRWFCSPLNHLTRLIARENIILSRRESNKSHFC